jgi:hypothetical protein
MEKDDPRQARPATAIVILILIGAKLREGMLVLLCLLGPATLVGGITDSFVARSLAHR